MLLVCKLFARSASIRIRKTAENRTRSAQTQSVADARLALTLPWSAVLYLVLVAAASHHLRWRIASILQIILFYK
ncbi:uncharacterized protein BO72DRAFT_151611 [Aspergillus fijiensis CBS 313.89]|uniref:Uncharacterized protein n=1 Tax=Aspergillus fijiensis CBS 313.89 TaxID=1448319 RepID=A0A8G1RNI8_9EURO|nr:uncharacterized protein BO72DRAFT_151611 [Aspergillus fijiensis CBS 313.89]RAK75989.1 hypothetical protein BO72DRAFT_151611 [Aspergillus fijiensis CBS 313.89]